MLEALKLRILQGDPVIHDVRNAKLPQLFRGVPIIENKTCPDGCKSCAEVCPTKAIQLNPLSIDLGKCVFCPVCEETCPEKIIHYTNDLHLGSDKREKLIITKDSGKIEIEKAAEKILSYFGKSLKLRQISAGGCNGCELELNALSNVNFDMGRFGIEFVASPRHADGIVITGPLTKNMANATEICYEAVPEPKIIILFGACSISGGIFQESNQINRKFIKDNKIDSRLPTASAGVYQCFVGLAG
jgi:Ni,Fe-hydrogenase III small subunit/NAD-dependent dihydropyrimidine dehydrogenase PreA subunit